MYSLVHHLDIYKQNIVMLLAIVITFLTPIHGMLLTTGLFVVLDTIFAVYVAVKLGGWSDFRSGKLWNICPKTVFYLLGVILSYLVDYYIIDGDIMGIKLLMTKFICMFFIYIEIKSLDETSQKLGNRSFWKIIKDFLTKAKNVKTDINDVLK